jgi:hypothetical protein
VKRLLANTLVLSSCLLVCRTMTACHKNNTNPPVTGVMHVSLTSPDNSASVQDDKWELIISDAGNRILLDTVTNANAKVSTSFNVYTSLVNLTTIVYNAGTGQDSVINFNGINPSSWTTLISPTNHPFGPVPVDNVPTVPDTIFYIHPPALAQNGGDFGGLYMSDNENLGGFWHPVYMPSDPLYQPGGLLVLPYPHSGNNPVFVLFNQLGLGNMHTSVTTHDTVDLTHIDTLAMIQYSAPSPYVFQYNFLAGYVDTADLDKSMQLWNYPLAGGLVEYPKTGVQAFELFSVALSASTKESLYIYSFGTSLPASVPFPTGQAYTISSNQADNFSVTFSSVSPSLYATTWQTGKINLVTVASADSITIYPSTLLSNLGSKLLQGQNFSGLSAVSFSWQQFAGMDYATAVNYFAIPAGMKTRHVSTSTTYVKTF